LKPKREWRYFTAVHPVSVSKTSSAALRPQTSSSKRGQQRKTQKKYAKKAEKQKTKTKKQKTKLQKANSTEASHAVTHRTTDSARRSLTSGIGRDPVQFA
jgi:hypothetical protein